MVVVLYLLRKAMWEDTDMILLVDVPRFRMYVYQVRVCVFVCMYPLLLWSVYVCDLYHSYSYTRSSCFLWSDSHTHMNNESSPANMTQQRKKRKKILVLRAPVPNCWLWRGKTLISYTYHTIFVRKIWYSFVIFLSYWSYEYYMYGSIFS